MIEFNSSNLGDIRPTVKKGTRMHTEYLEYSDGSTKCEAYVAYDDLTIHKKPCVLIAHAWGGQQDFERKKAEELAKLGYVGFALDNYGKGKRGTTMEENSKLLKPYLDDRKMLLGRLKAGLDAAEKHSAVDASKIAIMGYCFGGLCSLDMARSADPRIKCVVSFHGLFDPPKLGEQKDISARVLILHGYDDPMAKPDSVLAVAKELTAAKADWQIHAYGGTVHAFTDPGANMPENGILYNKSAADRSWTAMKDFLDEIF